MLKVSRSDKNFARLYMACSQRDKCDYFQWANSYLSSRSKAWKEQRLRERGNPLWGMEAKIAAARVYRQFLPHWLNDGKLLIQVDERSKLIVSPPELRGQRFRPELKTLYGLMLKTKEVEENLENSNMDHQTFLYRSRQDW